MLPIRLSPSGPIISNAEGGQAVPGEGFRLRKLNRIEPQGGLTLGTTPQNVPVDGGAGDLFITLPNPAPNKRYTARACVQLNSDDSGQFNVDGLFSWIVDSGSAVEDTDRFSGLRGAQIVPTPATSTDVSFGFQIEREITLGSSLPAAVVDGSVGLTCTLMLAGSSNVSLQVSENAYLEIEEML